jgi:hypothetical protein
LTFRSELTLAHRKAEGRNITLPNAQDYKKIRLIFNDGNMTTQERFFKLKSARKCTDIYHTERRERRHWTSLCLMYIIPLLWGKNFQKTVLFQSLFLLTPPMKMEKTECSETPAHKIQTPGNHPKERIQHSEQDENFKSRNCIVLQRFTK